MPNVYSKFDTETLEKAVVVGTMAGVAFSRIPRFNLGLVCGTTIGAFFVIDTFDYLKTKKTEEEKTKRLLLKLQQEKQKFPVMQQLKPITYKEVSAQEINEVVKKAGLPLCSEPENGGCSTNDPEKDLDALD